MSESKHTPGPWVAEAEIDLNGFETGKYWLLMGQQPCAYAFDRKEDAILAAAAPDMLEALKMVKAACGAASNWNGETRAFIEATDAAIAKATRHE